MRAQCVIGSLAVIVIEYIVGMILNVWLGLGIWDYSDLSFNLHGQVSLLFFFLFLLLIPFAIWLEDRLNWIWHKANYDKDVGFNYTLKQAYKELIFGERN